MTLRYYAVLGLPKPISGLLLADSRKANVLDLEIHLVFYLESR